MKFEGCVEAREISLTRKGANQHAHVLIRKTAASEVEAVQTPPEKTMTDAEKAAAAAAAQAEINKAARTISNKIAGMSDVTKAYYLALDDDKQDAFLAKSAEDMSKEAEAAKAEKERVASEAEAAKTGRTVGELAMQKRLDDQAAEIETLKADRADRDIEKRADTEFAGFPGGSAKVIPLLKAYSKMSEEDRLASEEILKAQCNLAKSTTQTFAARGQHDVSKIEGARVRIEEAAKAYAADHKVTLSVAREYISEQAEFADDVAAIG